jgi:hypothetical protein
MALMFLNGEGMNGGAAHRHIAGTALVAATRTAPLYRFFSFRDEFPGILPVADGGASIQGELYDVPMDRLRALVVTEPPELELTIVELDGGRLSFGMVVRAGEQQGAGVLDITEHGGWRAYRASRAARGPSADS